MAGLRRRGGSLGIEVTASNAATAGGIAPGLWGVCVRVGLALLCPRALTAWVVVAVREGMRGGMTTGCECECMVAAVCTPLGSGGKMESVVFGEGFSAGLVVRGEGEFFAARVPIFSDRERDEGGDCWRYGNDLGEYIILRGGLHGEHPVTRDGSLPGTARRL